MGSESSTCAFETEGDPKRIARQPSQADAAREPRATREEGAGLEDRGSHRSPRMAPDRARWLGAAGVPDMGLLVLGGDRLSDKPQNATLHCSSSESEAAAVSAIESVDMDRCRTIECIANREAGRGQLPVFPHHGHVPPGPARNGDGDILRTTGG